MNGMKEMKPEEAISFLDQVCAQVSLTRENHQRVLVAVGIMKNAIKNGNDAQDGDGSKDGG